MDGRRPHQRGSTTRPTRWYVNATDVDALVSGYLEARDRCRQADKDRKEIGGLPCGVTSEAGVTRSENDHAVFRAEEKDDVMRLDQEQLSEFLAGLGRTLG